MDSFLGGCCCCSHWTACCGSVLKCLAAVSLCHCPDDLFLFTSAVWKLDKPNEGESFFLFLTPHLPNGEFNKQINVFSTVCSRWEPINLKIVWFRQVADFSLYPFLAPFFLTVLASFIQAALNARDLISLTIRLAVMSCPCSCKSLQIFCLGEIKSHLHDYSVQLIHPRRYAIHHMARLWYCWCLKRLEFPFNKLS